MDNNTTTKDKTERHRADTAKDLRTEGKDVGKEVEKIFQRLNLEVKRNKLRASDVLQITANSLQSHGSCTEEELVNMFLQKLLMMNYKARSISVTKHHKQKQQKAQQPSASNVDAFSALFGKTSTSYTRQSNTDPIHPMDVQMAVFHCADGFLKQMMVTKLSQCRYALPLLVPDIFRDQIEFPLWTFREINQSWKIINKNNKDIISQIQLIYKAETPMVFFFRFGSVSSSKSELMNKLINEKHDTFFHRNCPGSSRTRVLMDGVVEIAWFCPSGTYDDKFTERVAFCNLHGDAGHHDEQMHIMTKMASVKVAVLPQLDRNDKSAEKIQKLYEDRKPLICLLPDDDSPYTEVGIGKYKIGLKGRGQADISKDLREAITDSLSFPSSESPSTFRLENVAKHTDIRVDQEYVDDCRIGRERAQEMVKLLEKKDLTKIKELFLPCQGKLWHQWCQKNKELHRPQGDDPEMEISKKKTEMVKVRELQHKSDISKFIHLFVEQMNSGAANESKFFLKWLRILLDEYTSVDLSRLRHEYDEKWSNIKLKDNLDKIETLNLELVELSKKLQAAAFGLEHILREIGQIYESCSSMKKNKKDLKIDYRSLPGLAAEMMISGFPLELMDGDAGHVPQDWVPAVLGELIWKLGDQRVFVLSILGIQSSGKSTMLNAMFGLQFAVSSGRCTRGAFMQLVKVSDEMKKQMNFDYILVVDTEGLRSQELAGTSTRHHDNELATFVIGLGNLTLINIYGENPTEMQDILQIVVQAFMRMKEVRLSPSCVFVHQNVSDVTAEKNTMEARRNLQKTLDKMTKLAAEDEVCNAECFSDVIQFDVQKDVKYFAQLWEGSPPMAPPNPSYCENVQDLKKTIISCVSKSKGMMLTHIKDHIQNLWNALLNERFVFSFKNALEITTYRKLETEYSKWTWSLRKAMLEIENRLQNKIQNGAINAVEERDLQEKLNVKSTEVKKCMSEFFEKDSKDNILIQWKHSFEIKISHIQENIVRETKSKLNEVLQQRDLKKKIDAQRTQNENALLEKAKDLALTLKHQANNETILQREFDSFWEKCVDEIKKDTPQGTDLDILKDTIEVLGDANESFTDPSMKNKGCNIFMMSDYSEYVQTQKQKRSLTNPLGHIYSLSKDDHTQIKTLISDTAEEATKNIKSKNIAKMGYNKSYIQELSGLIKAKLTDYEERQKEKYVFKKHFFSDLVLAILHTVKTIIMGEDNIFKRANDPVQYFARKRREYYSIFQKYCQGATSATIIGEIICNKLKEPIEQSVYKKTARDVADEIKANCESLSGNRSNLEKRILKTLAEKKDFGAYQTYIHNPKSHFQSFIREEVKQYITDHFNTSVRPKMSDDLKQKEKRIIEAVNRATEEANKHHGDADLWLKTFTEKLSDVLEFSENDLKGVSRDDVDVNHLKEVMIKEIPSIISDIGKKFSTESFPSKLDYKDRPDEILIEHLCKCCWVQCPFCKAICTNTAEDHDPQPHSVPFHRINGLNGWHYRGTEDLCAGFCTTLVSSNLSFYPSYDSKKSIKYKDYKTAGGDYAKWSITSDFTQLSYWKWVVCRFQKDLENYHKLKFQGHGEIPSEWRRHTKLDAIESLDKYI
ncbi:interferon-induced very large GTPase 1-like [Pimephales promelas]|uniref:interferon-induced very large GTPase 1-like n=1 Tax=Pimephales promelas TaxID=90988 RepID=UPI0019556A70|nr:interferon-induced very large GTPase 1-like [Pimephales promelas]KAG1932109.1 interferon-induced very large GTPase 1-like [Pimephales promelas]